MKKIKFETEPDLFDVHAEFNTIYGMVIASLSGSVNKKTTIERAFPNFVKITNEINEKIQKYAIKNELSEKKEEEKREKVKARVVKKKKDNGEIWYCGEVYVDGKWRGLKQSFRAISLGRYVFDTHIDEDCNQWFEDVALAKTLIKMYHAQELFKNTRFPFSLELLINQLNQNLSKSDSNQN